MPADSIHHTTLVAALELARHASVAGWITIDCRHDLAIPQAGRTAYDSGHIPSARFASLDTDLSDKRPAADGTFRGRHPLPEREAFIETLRRWGVNSTSQVVAYDAQGGMFAARLWWMLRWVGHEAVAVLDGGLQAWTAAGLPLSTEAVAAPRGSIDVRPTLVSTVSAADILADLDIRSRLVIDARSPDRFRGENETIDPVAGHIPGAANRFFKSNLDVAGRFKPAPQLRAEWESFSKAPQDLIMQCGSGATACHNLLALEIAGLHGAALYPGSWSEWCADPSRPVATGDA